MTNRTRILAVALVAPAVMTTAPVPAARGEEPDRGAAEALLDAGEHAAARDAFRERLRRHETTPPVGDPAAAAHRTTAAELRSQLMLCCYHLGDVEAALRWQESVVELRRSLPDSLRLADDLADLATIREALGDEAGAAAAWRESVELLEQLGPLEYAARLVPRMSAWAEHARRSGDYEESERWQRLAIERSQRALPRDFRHARLLNNLGALLWDEHRYDEAARLLHEALRISEEDPDTTPDRLAVALHNLANLAREQGEPERSESLHRRALALAREHLRGDPRFAYFLKEPAVLLAELDRLPEALALWGEALEAAADQPVLRSEILWERGRARLERNERSAADSSFAECLELRTSARGPDHPMTGQAHLGLGLVAAGTGGDPALARRHLRRAVEILRGFPVYPQDHAEAHVALARLHWRGGERTRAIAEMDTALALVEELRWHRTASETSRLEWTRRVADETHRMVGWLVAEGRVTEAVAAGERIRARVLADQLAAARVDWRSAVPAADRDRLAARERRARTRVATARRRFEASLGGDADELARIESELAEATRELRDAGEEIRLVAGPAASVVAPADGDAVERAAARLAPGERILSYHVGPRASYLIEIGPPGDLHAHELTVPAAVAGAWSVPAGSLGEETLASLVEAVAPRDGAGPARGVGGLTGSASPGRPRESRTDPALTDAERLGRILLPEAARARVLAAERVVFLPDGALHAWPMEALVLEVRDGAPRYWLDDGPMICHAPSLRAWLDIAGRPASCGKDGPLVSVCHPAYAGTTGASGARGRQWIPLPGTEREAEALAAAFPERPMRRLCGVAAREADLKRIAADACVLHLGTHGIVERDRSELLAALVLAREPPGSPDDGFLHLFEVYDLPLDCDVVVLSACDTKRGRHVRGEGVFALSRAFLAAGARRTVASLWSVNDEATARLVSELFAAAARTERETGQADWVRALRDAKRVLRASGRWDRPAFWA
ncbi:MAG TPA: CHAT domain-containing tetratricopeptide repeat protein, partial [bacterium]|nr:CHAT domain-containing tetratricopeptide repeat protein [bacterium]